MPRKGDSAHGVGTCDVDMRAEMLNRLGISALNSTDSAAALDLFLDQGSKPIAIASAFRHRSVTRVGR